LEALRSWKIADDDAVKEAVLADDDVVKEAVRDWIYTRPKTFHSHHFKRLVE